MEIKTKKVVESVTFSEDEKQFMKNLADAMEEECGNHFSCETCLFTETTSRWRGCEEFVTTLRSFANEERLEL